MRRLVGATWFSAVEHHSLCVHICVAAFFIGGLFGIFAGRSVNSYGAEALSLHLRLFLQAAQGGYLASSTPLELIWMIFRWPFLIVIFSMTVGGVALIPVLLLGRGFLLCFACSSLLAVVPGGGGVIFVLLCLSALFSVPALLVLSAQGLCHAGAQRIKRERFYLPPRLAAGVLGGFILCFLIDYYVVPMLVSALSHSVGG